MKNLSIEGKTLKVLPSSVMNSVTVLEKFDSSEVLSFKSGFLKKWKIKKLGHSLSALYVK